MRDLKADKAWLDQSRLEYDLTDSYILDNNLNGSTREEYQNHAPEWAYGITFVESTIAKEWLERAITAEAENAKLKRVAAAARKLLSVFCNGFGCSVSKSESIEKCERWCSTKEKYILKQALAELEVAE